jgi:hypothetical protein
MLISIVGCPGAFDHYMFASLERSNIACNNLPQKSIILCIGQRPHLVLVLSNDCFAVSIDCAIYARPGVWVYQAVVEPSLFELRFPHTSQTRDKMDTFAGVIGMLPTRKHNRKQLDALL